MERIIKTLNARKFLKPCYSNNGLYNSNFGNIIQYGLAKVVDLKLREILKAKPFSFFIDGWSDKKQSHLTIGIRYFD
jgi:hypothetical protein